MKKRFIKVIVDSILIFVIGIIYMILNKEYGIGIPCLFHKITGFYCPGCGATRCIMALLEGNIVKAFSYNALFFIMLPFIIIYWVYKMYIYIFDKIDKLVNVSNKVWIFLLMLTIMFGIIRNIEYFSFLRP